VLGVMSQKHCEQSGTQKNSNTLNVQPLQIILVKQFPVPTSEHRRERITLFMMLQLCLINKHIAQESTK